MICVLARLIKGRTRNQGASFLLFVCCSRLVISFQGQTKISLECRTVCSDFYHFRFHAPSEGRLNNYQGKAGSFGVGSWCANKYDNVANRFIQVRERKNISYLANVVTDQLIRLIIIHCPGLEPV